MRAFCKWLAVAVFVCGDAYAAEPADTENRDYLAPPTVGKLADLDPAQLVTPPKGLEIGYVPIATRQEQDTSRSVKEANR